MQCTGTVVKKRFAEGSKSERAGIFLVTSKGEYLLRREGGNPFIDPELEKLVGKTVSCEGVIQAEYMFFMSAVKVVPEPSANR